MFRGSTMLLLTALLMFPQIAETIYSPALTSISAHYSVTAEDAAQTLSIYFIGFAVGVLFWGRISDSLGRKPALLAGLGVYALGSLMALSADSFTLLLTARVIAAFGAATGSVVIQTILRDRYSGQQLISIFSFIGIALAISPAVGIFTGGELASRWGYSGVFSALAILALLLLISSSWMIPETRPANHTRVSLILVLRRMCTDNKIWLAVLLVALFNVSLFSYYSLAPFIFERLNLGARIFGYSGMVLAAGSVIGSQINRWLLKKGHSQRTMLVIACIVNLAGATGVYAYGDSLLLLLPMALVTIAFSMTIPIVLSSALHAYADCRGSAGALFGLFYYVLIGLGLMLAGWAQALGFVLLLCAMLSVVAAWRYQMRL
ncbi:MFS transporter [Izhakiella australiensis]|uniref:Bcr/CflA family efflux transporter n=1 Tax=Izhakiella australiensis TaxID=1926881 RepID=A0A1S8YIK6_9GAMM|nr:multidrug effflux MFS transporter [Izhakiella australiensis]OON38728.1 MFS transporter [Izhakiella australiensis]